MTLWQLSAAIAGYNRAQGGDDKPDVTPPSAAEARKLLSMVH